MVFAAGDIHAAPNMFSPDWGENGSRFWELTAAVRTGNLDQTLESILLAKDARVSNLDDARLLFSASLLRDVVRAGGRVWVRADVLQGWGQEVVWKSLSQITATWPIRSTTSPRLGRTTNRSLPIGSSTTACREIQKPPTSKNAADMKGICVFTAHA
jgi:hypothetical protein